MTGIIEEAVENFEEDNSSLKVLQKLSDLLVRELEDFSLSEKDINEHKLNMIIRNLEEDLDRVENEKLHDWNPEED